MSRNILVGIVVVIVLLAGGWWYFNQSSVPATSDTTQLPTTQQNANTGSKAPAPQPSPTTPQPATNRTYTGTGFEAVIPSSWKAVSGVNGNVSLQSFDYTAKTAAEVNERMGESKNWVKTGMVLEVFPQGNEVTGSWLDPAAYVQFHSDMNYSNLVTKKEISLGGQPALLLRLRADDGSLSESVSTVRNGREFQMTFRFANETSVDWAVWNQFLSSFKFL